ncbi:hypothetical protein RHGRI_024486 [Rhododendron griersonianum]|uniref:Anthranilate synthase n=1 Tax=Rhododendron griersonianum TaxID=479676 RepID=A0AAV6J9N9_9ERIC|nr:hypothetical protein RHGRI_024486 [Rhododendron griersonianum]
METLALSQVRPIIPSASFPHLSGHHSPSSLTLSRLRTLRCSALSSRSLGAAGGADDDHSARFRDAAEHGNLIPLYRRILSDHLTPVLAYRFLVKEDERDAPSFLFESVDPAGLHQASSVVSTTFSPKTQEALFLGWYSVIGAQPSMEIVAKENMVTIMDHREGRRTEEYVEDPMVVPRLIMGKWKSQRLDELPESFCGWWVGYFSYEAVHYLEKKKLLFLAAPDDDQNLPDAHLGLYDDVIVFDHVEKKEFIIHWVRLDQFSSVEEAFNDGMNRLNSLVSRMHDDMVPPRLGAGSIRSGTNCFGPSLKKSTMTSEAYKEAVWLAKEHILAGDIFQIVLSQRFERWTFADPFEVYRALRIVNPSPYMTYLQARGCILVASSPEILTRAKKVTGELLDHLTSWDALRAALPVGIVSGVPKLRPVLWLTAILVMSRESCEEKAKTLARAIDIAESSFMADRGYTLIGAQSAVEFVAKENFVTVIDGWEGGRREEFVEDPMRLLKRMMDEWKPQPWVGLPDTFCGGWFGYFSYNTFRYVEKMLPFSSAPKDDRYLPDIDVCLYDDVIVFDHVEQKSYLIHWVLVDRYASVEAAFFEGKSRLDSLFYKVQDGILPRIGKASDSYIFDSSLRSSNMTKEEYRLAVVKAKKSIGVGDHVVLSQRIQRRTGADPFSVYRVIGSKHPSPFRTYLKGRVCVLVSISQEILISLKQGKITKRALSWAEKKGRIPGEELEASLLGDEKERAKHMWMLDSEKIDIAKVCKADSVNLEKIREIEQHSRVIYMSSTVTGELFEHLSCWDALQAALPSAVVSGAPKGKAIELIDELEPTRRGPYGGSVGFVSFFGDMDMCVALDMILFPTGTGVAHIQAGVPAIRWVHSGLHQTSDDELPDEDDMSFYGDCEDE